MRKFFARCILYGFPVSVVMAIIFAAVGSFLEMIKLVGIVFAVCCVFAGMITVMVWAQDVLDE